MRINLKTTNITVTAEIHNYLNKKIESLQKFFDADDQSVIVDVEIGLVTLHHQSGKIFRAEFNIHNRNGHFRSEAEAIDLYSAIDEAKDEIALELGKKKKKYLTMLKRGGQKIKNLLRRFYS
jgi:ribosomal subunit interface protein